MLNFFLIIGKRKRSTVIEKNRTRYRIVSEEKAMENNKYPETLKIELVKRYLNGEQKVKICREYGIAKSTMWGWICKYQGMILKEWEIEGIEPEKNSCYVDIRKASEQVLNSSVVQASKNIIRIFINGYAIICDIEMLGKVKKVIEND